MKSVLIILIAINTHFTFCQISEGYFQFSIDVKAIDTSLQTRQTAGMLLNSKMEMYFAENRSRMDFNMGRMGTTSVIINRNTNSALTTNNSYMGNFAVVNTADELEINQPKLDPNLKVSLLNDTKVILGFKCKKAIIKSDSTETVYWYTDEIIVDNTGQTIINPNIPGFPLAFSSVQNGILMRFQASNINLELENLDELFSTDPPEGYQLMPQ